MENKTYHTVVIILKYHTVVIILKYHTVVIILKYHTVVIILKYHTVVIILKYHTVVIILKSNIKNGERAELIPLAHTYITALTLLAWHRHFSEKLRSCTSFMICILDKWKLYLFCEHVRSPPVFLWGSCCSSFLVSVLSYYVYWRSEFVLWCPLRFPHKNDVRLVFTASWL
jgi:hypothetical protein